MNIQNLLNQYIGTTNASPHWNQTEPGFNGRLSKLNSSLPGGFVGGAATGGIMALLMSNKSARKFTTTAATYGGAAIVTGFAYKAFKNWQQNNQNQQVVEVSSTDAVNDEDDVFSYHIAAPDFDLKLIKAMIASAKSDGHIDSAEQQNIFQALKQMDLTADMKATVFDLLNQPITMDEIVRGVHDITQKSELFLAACLVINPDHPSEQAYLDQLAKALVLPEGLKQQIQWQAQQSITNSG